MSKTKQALRKIEAPIYSYWQALYMSFYSTRLYIDVAKRWSGVGYLYLLLAVSIGTIPFAARIIYSFDNHFTEELVGPIKQIPPLLIQKGVLSFDKEMPFFIKNKEGAVVVIIDTTGTITKIDEKYPSLTLLIAAKQLSYRAPEFESFLPSSSNNKNLDHSVYVEAFDQDDNEIFKGSDWVASSGLLKLQRVTEIIIYPALVGFIFALYCAFMLMLALLGQFFSQIIFKFKLTFKESARLTCVASTPQIFLLFMVLASQPDFSGINLVYVGLISIYFSYAVLAIRRESKKMVRS